jgi:hypothetical protein
MQRPGKITRADPTAVTLQNIAELTRELPPPWTELPAQPWRRSPMSLRPQPDTSMDSPTSMPLAEKGRG